jgi:anti-sigma factor RsiW
MNCEGVDRDLFSYIDGQLSPSQELTVKHHLDKCESCRSTYRRIVGAWDLLDEWEEAPLPAGLRKRILDGIRSEKKVFRMKMLIPVAAGLLIIIAAVFSFRGTETRDYRELTAVNRSAPQQALNNIPGELEDDIISNLHLLTEKEFYDSFDRLENLDYLPLVDDQNGYGEDQRSALEAHSA